VVCVDPSNYPEANVLSDHVYAVIAHMAGTLTARVTPESLFDV